MIADRHFCKKGDLRDGHQEKRCEKTRSRDHQYQEGQNYRWEQKEKVGSLKARIAGLF